MAAVQPPDTTIVSAVLDRLQHLNADNYVLAFGPDGRQFFATPNGYSATHLPLAVLSDVYAGHVRRIIWASFGSKPDSWFFGYEMNDGTHTFRIGPTIPKALHGFIEQIRESPHFLSSLRVQLGVQESFVVWSGTTWACANIPNSVVSQLYKLSSMYKNFETITKGSFKEQSLSNFVWHDSGSFYLNNGRTHLWNYKSELMHQAWHVFWKDSISGEPDFSELAYVAIDSHAPAGNAFAFLRKQRTGQEAPFVMHLNHGLIYSRLPSNPQSTKSDDVLEHVFQEGDEAVHHQWATSKKAGRPNPRDTRELKLNKGERIKILQDMGRNWFIAQSSNKMEGWVHGSWLDFGNGKSRADAKATYARFQQDMRKLLIPGRLHNFPCISDYTDACIKDECKPLGNGSLLGICVHNLQALLMGSGTYSYEWLKEERNVWHPDKFARYCQADHKERLRPNAQELFVLYGVLMDKCRAEDGDEETGDD